MELTGPRVKVYLSGNMHLEEHDWRAEVLAELKDYPIDWLIPIEGPFKKEWRKSADYYVARDKLSIQMSDMVFGFLEDIARNVGTIWELGYASGRGKLVVLVNTCHDIRSYDFPEVSADVVFRTLKEGITALKFIVHSRYGEKFDGG